MKKVFFIKLISFIFIGLLSIIGFFSIATAKDLTAKEVMEKYNSINKGATASSDMTMILIDRRSNKRIYKMKNYRKAYGKDSKSIMFFISPANVKNTGYLQFKWNDTNKENDSWLYNPALGKVKRIASSDKSSSFMRSDFSYADLDGIDIENYDFKFMKKSEKIDGHDTWVIEALPKKSIKNMVIKKTGYLKILIYIRKDIFQIVKAKYYVKKGKKIKYLKLSDLKIVNGIWTAHKIEMITTKRRRQEHTTVILIDNIKYNIEISDDFFTTRKLKRDYN